MPQPAGLTQRGAGVSGSQKYSPRRVPRDHSRGELELGVPREAPAPKSEGSWKQGGREDTSDEGNIGELQSEFPGRHVPGR